MASSIVKNTPLLVHEDWSPHLSVNGCVLRAVALSVPKVMFMRMENNTVQHANNHVVGK